MARDVKPPRSPIAMPGRKYVSGIIYLTLVVVLALSVLGLRWCIAR
jgi:hypothetical protein